MSTTNGTGSIYGDAEARRRSVLDAAAELLDEGGYAALTNRAVAKRANISTGLIYQYFVDKQDIYVALLQESQEELTEFVRALPREDGVAALLSAVVPETTRQWSRVGHLAASWRDSDGNLSERASIRALSESTDRQFSELLRALEDAAAAEGRQLRTDPALLPFVWSGLMGLADTLVNKWARGVKPDALIKYSAESLARAITE
ncbi:TetR/AcrR family transcriptional regulator [Nocardioides alcanivorans]|uniref:TetR/AcrR family transcriptional regulator n=1 Tax=Nocardioides alcanivorans TaxID=2897352 RepID=UPI001F224FD5|nr:TetR/AcrR family transcriptional regulator [Nocardioides alcanivorans]